MHPDSPDTIRENFQAAARRTDLAGSEWIWLETQIHRLRASSAEIRDAVTAFWPSKDAHPPRHVKTALALLQRAEFQLLSAFREELALRATEAQHLRQAHGAGGASSV